MSNKEKAKQLGMPQGTAANRLRKMIMFSMMIALELDNCWQCGEKIEHVSDLSIEHKIPWLHSDDPIGLYFDLDNIAFSHLKCNVGSGRRYINREEIIQKLSLSQQKRWEGKRVGCGTTTAYSRGCRCEACKRANTEYMEKYRNIPENREKHNFWERERYRNK